MNPLHHKGRIPAGLLVLALVAGCGDDGATGDPLGERSIIVPLAYDEGSNFGAKGASGTAEIETKTGKISITVVGLSRLANDLYEGWLTGGGEKPRSTGTFNTDGTGIGRSETILGDISKRAYTRVELSVEPVPDPESEPDVRRNIGGEIPPADNE